jgi:hypothetical protein
MVLPTITTSSQEAPATIWYDADRRRIALEASAARKLWRIAASAPTELEFPPDEKGLQITEDDVQYISFTTARALADSLRIHGTTRALPEHERLRQKGLNKALSIASNTLAAAALMAVHQEGSTFPEDPSAVVQLYQAYCFADNTKTDTLH